MKTNNFYERYDNFDEKLFIKKIILSICLLVGISIAFYVLYSLPPDVQKVDSQGILINGKKQAAYHNITDAQRTKYDIPLDYVPCKDDLGDQIGIVWNWKFLSYKGLNGCKVYSYIKHPDKKTIRIIATPSGYYFFTCEWLDIEVKVGENSNILMAALELPDSLEMMEVISLNADLSESADKNLHENITDIGESVLDVLSGKQNIGEEEKSRRYAKLWYDTYGNDNVYYDEKQGIIRLQLNTYNSTNIDWDANEHLNKANEIWNKGSTIIKITTKSV